MPTSRKSCDVARHVLMLTVTLPVAPAFSQPLKITSSDPSTAVLASPVAFVWCGQS